MRYCLGVDLGTSFSAGAVGIGDRVELIEVGGERRTPSTVLLTEDGTLLGGTWAQRSIGRLPHRVERNPKRYVGRPPMLLGGEPVSAARALAVVLGLFVEEARRRVDGKLPTDLVLTHPVAWSDEQRSVLVDAGREVLPDVDAVLVPEPVAAAAYYAQHHALNVGDSVAVYDLGGGTFDTAVLALAGGGFELLGQPGGDPSIGGESFDERVFLHFGEQLGLVAPQWWVNVRAGSERRWQSAAAALLNEARIAKEALSSHPSAQHYVQDADAEVSISRAELEDLIGADVVRTRALLDATIEDAGVSRATLRGVFLTGGASRTPMVQRYLEAQFDGLVRTWQDPKTAVALGAARWPGSLRDAARTRSDGYARSTPPEDLSRRETPRAEPQPDLVGVPVGDDRVREVRVAAGALYSLGRGSDGRDVLRRIDPRTGRVDRELALGQIVGWATSDEGMLVAERREASVHLHVVGSELAIRSSRVVDTPRDPDLVVDAGMGWAFVRGTDTRPVDYTMGFPWGETGTLAVELIPLGSAFTTENTQVSLGSAAFWYLNENGVDRRLLDPSSPTSILPPSLCTGVGPAVVIGWYSRSRVMAAFRRSSPGTAKATRAMDDVLGKLRRNSPVIPSQEVLLVGATGVQETLVEETGGQAEVQWIQQLLRSPDSRSTFLATTAGLLVVGVDEPSAPRELRLARPGNGAVRWVPAGATMFGVMMEHVLPNRDVSLHVLEGDRVREVGRWPSLLGHLMAAGPGHAPRIVVQRDEVWLGVGDDEGTGSQVIGATADGARVVASGTGWLEPVGRAGGQVFALHAPQWAPGDERPASARLVQLVDR